MKHAPPFPFLTGLLAALLLSASIQPAQQPQNVDEKVLRDWADRGDADAQFEL